MFEAVPRIDVCICTYRRPQLLARLLEVIRTQVTEGRFTFSILVGENDSAESSREVVEDFRQRSGLDVSYVREPIQNIARVRNRILKLVHSPLLALIDDDEVPGPRWLLSLFETLEFYHADGVLGPVVPEYAPAAPTWVRKAGLYDFRKRHATGTDLSWLGCRTGNALLRREVIDELSGPFREEFATGGEDQDFFRRSMELGRKFFWCDEAIAHETIPPRLWQRRVLLARALLRGKDTFRHKEDRWPSLRRALVAVPLYTLCLPFALLAGQHRWMKLILKLTAHFGFLLACLRLNPMQQRPM